ncbi:MAG: hypothetical protein AAB308_07480, partial [Nitrospirota bacterium]
SVVTQYTDPLTSFTATVFKDTSGDLTLAIRGTLEGGDFLTDGYIALNGAGYDQIVSMYNWWQRVSNSAGQSVSQYQIKTHITVLGVPLTTPPAGAIPLSSSNPQIGVIVTTYLEPAASALATGALVAAMGTDADGKLDVTGHSLGGHLAMAFASLFPAASSQITVFNAPGFTSTPNNSQFFAKLGGSIPNGTNTTNVIADEANVGTAPWSAVASLHNRPGEAINIAIENQVPSGEPDKPGALNHSQMILTDALAVYNLLAKLDPGLSSTTFKGLLGAADNTVYQSLERIVDAMERLLLADKTLLPTGNTQRDALYNAIYALQGNLLYQQSTGLVTIRDLSLFTASQIALV